jgi:Protein of unknown function (DUF2630)
MDDNSVLARINELVREEHELRGKAAGQGLDQAGRQRLAELEVQLDQYWDLLRQRRAKEEYDANPDHAAERPAGEVETYLQ